MSIKRKLAIVLFNLFLTLGHAPAAWADVIDIPEIKSQVSEEFVLESIARIDDFIEEVEHLKNLRGKQNAGFVISGVAQIGALSGVMIDRLWVKSALFNDAVSDFKNLSTVGKAGSTVTVDASKWTRRWLVTSGAVQNVSKGNEKAPFTVHPEDLPIFISILREVRDHQNLILHRFLKEKSKNDTAAKYRLENQSMLILQSRPSYQKIAHECEGNPSGYKTHKLIEMYQTSLGEYFRLLMLDASTISAQIESKYIAPSLNRYLKQDVLPFALRKCFRVSKDANGIFEDESDRFVAQLLGVDMAAKFVVIAAIYSVWQFKEFIASHAGKSKGTGIMSKIVGKIPPKIMNAVLSVKNLFAKISPGTVAKIVVATQIASSSYALWSIKKDYDALNANNGDRRAVMEFRKLAYKKLLELADENVQALQRFLDEKEIGVEERVKLESEIKKWEAIKIEYKTQTFVSR